MATDTPDERGRCSIAGCTRAASRRCAECARPLCWECWCVHEVNAERRRRGIEEERRPGADSVA